MDLSMRELNASQARIGKYKCNEFVYSLTERVLKMEKSVSALSG